MKLRVPGALDKVRHFRLSMYNDRSGWDGLIGYSFWYPTLGGYRCFEFSFDKGSRCYEIARQIFDFIEKVNEALWSENLDPRRSDPAEEFLPCGNTLEFKLSSDGDLICRLSESEDDDLWWNTREILFHREKHVDLVNDLEFLIEEQIPRWEIERICRTCGSDWSLGEHDLEQNCSECGGYSKYATCTDCDTSCGRRVIRDVATSNETGKASWLGGCGSKASKIGRNQNDPWVLEMISGLLLVNGVRQDVLETQGNLFETKEGLLVSIGDSPLPVLLAIELLRPPKLAIVCARNSVGHAERLIKLVESSCAPEIVRFDEQPYLVLEHSHDIAAVADQLGRWKDVFQNYIIFFSGGTKAMAGELSRLNKGNPDSLRCHLGSDGILRFNNGSKVQVAGKVDLPIELLAQINGCEIRSFTSVNELRHSNPGIAESRIVWQKFSSNRNLPNLLRALTSKNVETKIEEMAKLIQDVPSNSSSSPEFIERVFSLAKQMDKLPPIKSGQFGNAINHLRLLFPELSLTRESIDGRERAWIDFFRGGWLEVLVSDFVANAVSDLNPDQTFVNVKVANLFHQKGFELDIVHLFNQTGNVISCTTDDAFAKSKLFELAARSKQLCGKYARAALVVPAERKKIVELRKELNGDWIGNHVPPAIFGYEELEQWSKGDLSELRSFLLGY